MHITMYMLTCSQNILSSECLITHTMAILMHITTYMLTCNQNILSSECLITHITGLWTRTTMCVYAFPDYCVHWMTSYKHHRYMDTYHDVHCDVLPIYSVHWMPYYTHHRNMDSHHYVSIDVLSGQSVEWMPNYHITGIWMLTTVYAFMSSGYMKLFRVPW